MKIYVKAASQNPKMTREDVKHNFEIALSKSKLSRCTLTYYSLRSPAEQRNVRCRTSTYQLNFSVEGAKLYEPYHMPHIAAKKLSDFTVEYIVDELNHIVDIGWLTPNT